MSQPQYIPVNPYPQAGEVLEGKYRVEQLLGEGGMGAVAKAIDLLRRAPVAIKFMSPAVLALQGAVERFVNEGVAASQIDSDHVVKVFDVGRMPTGAPYLVMEYLDGCDLGQLLAREGGRLETIRAVHFTLQILRALQTAHASGIIHRDMKPSNCFIINKDGEPDFVKLVDFGISKVRSDDTQAHQANLTRTNSALGTPLYMSPEQARSPRDVDHRADLYSVGAILYELLTGRTPYIAESGEYTEILFKIFTTEPEPLRSLRPEIDEGLAQVVHHALTRDPNQRFSSASEFAEALVPFADERSGQVVQRLRGGRGRSLMPASQAYVPGQPGGPGTGARGPVTGARGPVTGARGPVTGPQGPMSGVHGSAPGAPMQTNPTPGDALRAPRVPTDVGVTRETPPQVGQPAPRSSKVPLVVAFVAVVLLCAGGGVFVYRNRQAPAPAATRDPMESATVVAPPPPSLLPSAGIPSASLSPLPSATLAPSASSSSTTTAAPPVPVGNQAGAPGNPNGAPSNKTKPPVPVNLNGVQPHF